MTTTISWRPMDPIDRSWSGVSYVRSVVGLDLPPYDRIRAALAGLARDSAEIGRWWTPTPARWGVLTDADRDAWLDDAIGFLDEPGADAARTFEVNGPLDAVPLRVLVGPDWISLRMTHAMGDGQTVNAVMGHLLQRAHSDVALAVPWTALTARGRDRVIAKDVAAHPGAVAWALRHRAELAGGRYEPAALEADAMPDLTIAGASRVGFAADLRELRDRWFPGASAAAVANVALRGAFAGTLPEPRPGFECLFNTRSAATATCWGNWSAGVFIRPSDDWSPLATSAEMTRVRDSGLAGLACASLRLKGRAASGETVQVAAREGAPRLTLSYMQKHAMAGLIPGLRSGESVLGTLSRPNGVDTITVQAVEFADRLSTSVSFYPDVWGRADVQAALDHFHDDPVACLARALPRGASAR